MRFGVSASVGNTLLCLILIGCDVSEQLDTPDLEGSRGMSTDISGRWVSPVDSVSGSFTQRVDVSYSPTNSEPEVQYSVWEVGVWTEAEFMVEQDSIILHLEMPYQVSGQDWYLLNVLSSRPNEPTTVTGLHGNIGGGWDTWKGIRPASGSIFAFTHDRLEVELIAELVQGGMRVNLPADIPFKLERMCNCILKDGQSTLLSHSPFSELFKADYSVFLTKAE